MLKVNSRTSAREVSSELSSALKAKKNPNERKARASTKIGKRMDPRIKNVVDPSLGRVEEDSTSLSRGVKRPLLIAADPILGRGDDDSKSLPRGGVVAPFPKKLHDMLGEAEDKNFCHVVSWQCHGRAFTVHKPLEFVRDVMPAYFHQTKMASFQRQLNLYAFKRVTSGPDKGAYFHNLFLRGRYSLCDGMTRTKIKGTRVRKALTFDSVPDFYKLPFMPSVPCRCKTPPLPQSHEGPSVRTANQTHRSRRSAPKQKKIKSRLSNHFKHSSQYESSWTRAPSEDERQSDCPSTPPLTSEQGPSSTAQGSSCTYDCPPALVTPDYQRSGVVIKGETRNNGEGNKCGDVLFFEGKPFHYLDHGYGVHNVLCLHVPNDS